MSSGSGYIVNKNKLHNYDSRVQFLLLLQEYTKESTHNRTYDDSNADDWITNILYSDDIECYLAIKDERIVGFCVVGADRDFYKEPFGLLSKFYVHPSARGTNCARQLMLYSIAWLDAKLCHPSFATASAGVGEDKEFENLCAKYGFQRNGNLLQRG